MLGTEKRRQSDTSRYKSSCRRPWASPEQPTTVRPKYRRTATGEEWNIFTLHLVLYQGLHPVAAQSAEMERDPQNRNPKAAEL